LIFWGIILLKILKSKSQTQILRLYFVVLRTINIEYLSLPAEVVQFFFGADEFNGAVVE